MRFATALLLAAVVHLAVLALAGRLLPQGGARPAPAPELQVTTVELSLAERDETEGAVGAPSASAEMPVPVPRSVEHALEAMPEMPVRDEGTIPLRPEIRMAESSLEPSLPEAPPAEPASVAENLPTAAETRETARVDVPPQPRTTFRPVYPRGCRARREEGIVTLEIEVSAGGVAAGVRVEISSGFPELDAAAVAAARRAGFVPASREGRPVPGTVRLPVSFKLR